MAGDLAAGTRVGRPVASGDCRRHVDDNIWPVMLIANLAFSSAVAVRRLCDSFFSRRAMMWPRNP